MTISIFKFGGSCLKDAAAFEKIGKIMKIHSAENMIFVASALQGITDKLIDLAKNATKQEYISQKLKEIKDQHVNTIEEVFKKDPDAYNDANCFIQECIADIQTALYDIEEFGLENSIMDYIMSYGEKMSTYLLYLYVDMMKIPADYILGEDIIITDNNFGNALPLWDHTLRRIRDEIAPIIEDKEDNTIFCVTGFIGRDKLGNTTTLGRGGSDFTATIIARCLYDSCEDKDIRVVLWKDVSGILSTNPKYAKDPKLIKNLNYDEAREMAFYGAKILHPKCLFGLDERHIVVEIRSFDNPESEVYSTISDKSSEDEITGISTIEDVCLLTVSSGSLVSTPGVLAKIFSIMGDNEINVSMVAQSSSEVNTTFVVEKQDGPKAYELIKTSDFFKGWAVVEQQIVSILAVTGKKINKSSVQAKIFSALAKENINIIAMSQAGDGLNLSMVLKKEDVVKAVKLINECDKCH